MDTVELPAYKTTIRNICQLNWSMLDGSDLVLVAWAYYYFSIQFRENLEIAVSRDPDDEKLQQLWTEECNTPNLSPWPGVAGSDERMNHDEFMRRTLMLAPIDDATRTELTLIGETYLRTVRGHSDRSRAMSIASYEDGGLESVFRAILTAPNWSGPVLAAFHHFLSEHIRFDSDPEQGHGALSRHMAPEDSILPLWEEFRTLLTRSVPKLARGSFVA